LKILFFVVLYAKKKCHLQQHEQTAIHKREHYDTASANVADTELGGIGK
jgi:hypothetical protein